VLAAVVRDLQVAEQQQQQEDHHHQEEAGTHVELIKKPKD
jgi:hypothetical protein